MKSFFFSSWLAAALAAVFLTTAADAQTLPLSYQLQLQGQANLDGTAYDLPNGSTFNSVSPSINDSGAIAGQSHNGRTNDQSRPLIWRPRHRRAGL